MSGEQRSQRREGAPGVPQRLYPPSDGSARARKEMPALCPGTDCGGRQRAGPSMAGRRWREWPTYVRSIQRPVCNRGPARFNCTAGLSLKQLPFSCPMHLPFLCTATFGPSSLSPVY
ncbi:hypothetical protein Y1Q_0004996 [Alligator mississippiensis]|uniref:Uncharacterized protein n=1 Tax=Alligator mississippiensis TaxID=8496 RepID=A0A151LZF9_ALLMI|nr:hypothetical protein Y1Q_0004996 [Alligator mississippiensis]